MISGIRELDIGWELGMYALAAAGILIVVLMIAALVVLIQFLFRSGRYNRPDAR